MSTRDRSDRWPRWWQTERTRALRAESRVADLEAGIRKSLKAAHGLAHYECRAGEDRQRDRTWCREGMAVADEQGRLVDTYWGGSGDSHVLTAAEIATAEVLFNVNDYDELDRWRPNRATWMTYAEADRGRITSQHRLQERLFIRKGAQPDLGTQIENAREAVEEAESKVRSAQSRLDWARRDLAALLDEQTRGVS